MRYSYLLLTLNVVLLLSCKKEYRPEPVETPPATARHILLKDITIPNLPSPYYHFEYNTDSLATKADFASGFSTYAVLYNGSMISEMRNNILVNHDTLRYQYNNAGKLVMIGFINASNVMYRHVFFAYSGDQVREIRWDIKEGNVGFLIDRTLNFAFYADGNVKTITENRPSIGGAPGSLSVKTFEQYDDKINVDDFSQVHDGFHDHLLLLQGFRLQKNNPKKETLSVSGSNLYTVDYTYTYNSDNTPSHKAGDFVYLSGSSAGQRFQTNSFYSYY